MLLLVIEEGSQRTQPHATFSPTDQVFSFWDNILSLYGERLYGQGTFLLDADNDSETEFIVRSHEEGEIFKIFKNVEGGRQIAEVEKVSAPNGSEGVSPYETFDIFLTDVDNDGRRELVCNNLCAYNSALLFYKYRDGMYVILKKGPENATSEGFDNPWFLNAYITDVDDDGRVEVVSEPKSDGYLPAQTRYVWRWNEKNQVLEVVATETIDNSPND